MLRQFTHTNKAIDSAGQVIKSDRGIFITLYLVALLICLRYALTDYVITSDQLAEYNLYIKMIEQGGVWSHTSDSLISSCLLVYYVPALLHLITGIDKELIIRIYPSLFFALTPAFVYLISRHYLTRWQSVISTLLIFGSFYFMVYPALGRVAVAWGIMAGLYWAVTKERKVWAGVFALLLIFSHYGTSFIAIMFLLALLFGSIITKKKMAHIITPMAVLFIGIMVWYSPYYTGTVQSYAIDFTKQSYASVKALSGNGFDLGAVVGMNWLFNAPLNYGDELIFKAVFFVIIILFISANLQLPMKTRLLYYALLALIFPLSMSWLMVIALGMGIGWIIYRREMPANVNMLNLAAFGLILMGVFVPYFSTHYGAGRIFFTSSIVLAPCIVLGLRHLEKLWVVPDTVISGVVLVMYQFYNTNIMVWFPRL